MCGRNIVEQNVECNGWSKHKRTKSQVQYVVETKSNTKCGGNIVEQKVEYIV